jgi:hypothetical protein
MDQKDSIPKAQKSNPGGLLAPENVIGRDTFIEQLWYSLAQQSVILLAERRIGKSSILRKIEKERQSGWLPILWDVEGINSVASFVKGLQSQLRPHLEKLEQGKDLFKRIHAFFKGSKQMGFEVPKGEEVNWLNGLTHLLKVLGQYQQTNQQQILLIWDEFPWMLQKIIKNEGHQAAGDLLDILRHCRQSNENLRMLFTGSIGLHQVINVIRAEGYSNEPVNDMLVRNLDALTASDACLLANALIKGESISDKAANIDITELCALVDNVPYYIHHLIKDIRDTDQSPVQLVKAAIADTNNAWQLEHYYTRLQDYYGDQQERYALVLDVLAFADTGLKRQAVLNTLASNPLGQH